jgi:hypothetical protein
MSGNISTTELTKDSFIKYLPYKDYNYKIGIFQTRLYYNIKDLDGFCINKKLLIDISDPTIVKCHYEIVNEKQWELDKNSVKLIAKNMAKIHNYCYIERNTINLPHKKSLYDDFTDWEQFVKNKIAFKQDLILRKKIYNSIKDIDERQIKIALHRDFRKHNILWDGTKYTLIDFDFAAYDFISLEIMGFISDILDVNHLETSINLIKEFFRSYKYYSTISGIIWKDLPTDYINYLCVNTFPLYLKNTIPKENYKELLHQRNIILQKIYDFKDELKEIIIKIK